MSENYHQSALRIANRKMPVPKNKVQAPMESLAKCNNLAVRAEIVKQDPTATNTYWISIDDMKIYFYEDDNSLLYIDDNRRRDDIDIKAKYIGGGVFIDAHEESHISTPWGSMMWYVSIPKQSKSLQSRQGWFCLMRRKDEHRDMVALQLTKACESMFAVKPNYFVFDQVSYKDEFLPDARFNNLVPQMFRDIPLTGIDNQVALKSLNYYNNCLINVVAETTTKMFFATEKVYKSIASKQLFVIIGCHHYLRRLRKMGFQTFSPYIDESYDSEKDLNKRVKKAMFSANNFLKQKHKPFDALQRIVDHNKNRLKHLRSICTYDEHVNKKIKKYIRF